jgi:hypothetical protein
VQKEVLISILANWPERLNDPQTIDRIIEGIRHPARMWGPRSLKKCCKHGHEFTPENTVMEGNQRRCCICQKEKKRRFNQRRRERRVAECNKSMKGA